MEGEHVYLLTIFHEATAESLGAAPPDADADADAAAAAPAGPAADAAAAAGGPKPPPALAPTVAPTYAAAAAAFTKRRDEATALLATCRRHGRGWVLLGS